MILEIQKANLGPTAIQAADATFLGQLGISEPDGVIVVTRPGEWAVNSGGPAAATQAVATKAAGAAGVRHVCTMISWTLATGATAQATAVNIGVRDGTTGVGAFLFVKQVILPANSVWEGSISGLNLVGSPATAMTLEFNVAGVAGSFETVSMAGYDAA